VVQGQKKVHVSLSQKLPKSLVSEHCTIRLMVYDGCVAGEVSRTLR
jgi:hypothetical protein